MEETNFRKDAELTKTVHSTLVSLPAFITIFAFSQIYAQGNSHATSSKLIIPKQCSLLAEPSNFPLHWVAAGLPPHMCGNATAGANGPSPGSRDVPHSLSLSWYLVPVRDVLWFSSSSLPMSSSDSFSIANVGLSLK